MTLISRAEIGARLFDAELGAEHFADYQNQAYEFLWDLRFAALYLDLGLGKTAIVLRLISELQEWFAFHRCLIIGPLRVVTQTWPNEMRKWNFSALIDYTILRAEGFEDEIKTASSRAYRQAAAGGGSPVEASSAAGLAATAAREAIRIRQAMTKTSVHLINREAVPWLVNLFGKTWPYDMVIIDESTAFKDHSTSRFKSLVKVLPYITRLHELTASPMTETYMGLFAQTYLLDRGARFGKHITPFRKDYFAYNSYDRSYTLLPGAEDKIIAKISDICLVMKADEYLPDVLKPTIIPRKFNLTPGQLRQYKDFERSFILELPEDVEIEAETAAALGQKLLQLASGAVYDADGSTHIIHDHKIEELHEIVEEVQGEPILVAYWYKSSLTRLRKAFPKAIVLDRTGSQVDDWNAGKIKMLLVHPMSAGHGLNMQFGGHLMVIFDQFWSLELWLQLIGRIARQGQKHAVMVWSLIAARTSDEIVGDRLIKKENAQNVFFQKLRELQRKLLLEKRAVTNIEDAL